MDVVENMYLVFIVSIILCHQGTISQINNGTNVTINSTDSGYLHVDTTIANTSCRLFPNVSETRDEIANLANGDYKLVKLKIRIDGTNITSRNIYSTSVYQPRQWVITTSLTGKSMLMLREYFEPMSMYTLGLGVASMDITLHQHPTNCLDNIHVSEIASLLRTSIINNFGSDSSLPENAEVCNQHIVTKGAETAKLVYVCCRTDLYLDGGLYCMENTETIWVQLLFISLFLIQGYIVAYCPMFLPETLFKARTVFQEFVFKTGPEKSLVLNVKCVDTVTHIDKNNYVKTRRHTFTHLNGFKEHLRNMTVGKVYSMYVKEVNMRVRETKLTAAESAPVGVMKFVYKFFIRCTLRKEIASVSKCCTTKICKSITDHISLRWYQVLRVVMLILFLGVCISPWILRIWFYYTYEQDVLQYKVELYNTLNLSMPFNGFFVAYLSPLHPIFITIYILLLVEILVYWPLPAAFKRKLKFTIRKCFRDMRDSSRLDACGYFISSLLSPLTKWGILGCLLTPLFLLILPLLLLLLALEVLPLVNLTFRLLLNLVYYILRMISPHTFKLTSSDRDGPFGKWMHKRLSSILVTDFHEQNVRKNQIIHLLSLIMTLASIGCIIIITIDCISFYVECLVYGLIGFILNPSYTMKYVSLILLIVMYGVDCFSSVNGRYVTYGKAINSQVQEMVGDRMKEVAAQSANDQVNAAFRIEGDETVEPLMLVAGSERYLKWRAPRLVLFLDRSDIPFIPKSFLMEMGKLQHAFCPGPVHMLYLKALMDFSLIVLFLLFVFIVIFAFGQAQDISSGGQAIAALGSGFLPLILRKFLFQSQSGPSVDTSNIKWHYMFLNAVHKYKDRWNFEDMRVDHIVEAGYEDKVKKSLGVNENENDEDQSEHSALLTVNGEDTNHGEPTNLEIKSECASGTANEKACEIKGIRTNAKANTTEVDLIVKKTKLNDHFEFYVPRSRAAETEDNEQIQLNVDNCHETVV